MGYRTCARHNRVTPVWRETHECSDPRGKGFNVLCHSGAATNRRYECSRACLGGIGKRVQKQVHWQLVRMNGTWRGSWEATGHTFNAEHVARAAHGAVAQRPTGQSLVAVTVVFAGLG